MKNTRILRACGATLLSTAFLLALAPASRATDLIYTVQINTASLIGNPDSPFSLDLQLVTGSSTGGHGNVTNTATLSNFIFNGGVATESANFTQGGESGSFGTSVVLTNSSLNNEFAEGFTTFPTSIQFKVDETTNSETVTSGTPLPDQFNVYIDDNNTSDGFVPTNDPSGADTLISSTINSGILLGSVNAYSSISPDPGVSAAAVVPEPGAAALLLCGVASLVLRRKRNAAPQAA